MRHLVLSVLAVSIVLAAPAQPLGAQEPAAPRREAKVRRLLELQGQKEVAKKTMDKMMDQFGAMPMLPPGFIEKFKELSTADGLVELIVPVYLKHYDEAELDAMIAFWASPMGQRLRAKQAAVTLDSTEAGRKWGETLAQQVLQELGLAPPGARPNAAPRTRVAVNEQAAIGTLRSITTAQEQFKQQSVVDQDADGMGEYGWLGELSGGDACRVHGLKMNTSPFIPAILGVKDSNGFAQKSGYYYVCYLPTKNGPAAREGGYGTPHVAVRDDADAQEVRWAVYAWPNSPGKSGNLTFMTNNAGEVYATQATVTPYGGADKAPGPGAAYDGSDPAAARNLSAGIGLHAAKLKALDGNLWFPAGMQPPTAAAAVKIPFLVNPKTQDLDLPLFKTAELVAGEELLWVAKGTRCKIVETREKRRSEGGTAYRVRTPDGDVGWVPGYCLEYRNKK